MKTITIEKKFPESVSDCKTLLCKDCIMTEFVRDGDCQLIKMMEKYNQKTIKDEKLVTKSEKYPTQIFGGIPVTFSRLIPLGTIFINPKLKE